MCVKKTIWLCLMIYSFKMPVLLKRFYRVDSVSRYQINKPRAEAVGMNKDDGGYSEAGLLILDECQLILTAQVDKNMH
jgi:hypothetical protein